MHERTVLWGAPGWRRTVAVPAMAAVLTAAALVAGVSSPAAAGGGDLLDPARDRYEPGQIVTMIGYGTPPLDGAVPWRETTFHGYLRPIADIDDPRTGLQVGQVVVQEVAPYGSRSLRVSIEFRLPADLAPDTYVLDICDDPCTGTLAYFMPSQLYVGVDPEQPLVRHWPYDDPAVRWLEDDALVSGHFYQPITAADIRAGRIPPEPPPFVPEPTPAPPPPAADTGATTDAGPAAEQAPARPRPDGDAGPEQADRPAGAEAGTETVATSADTGDDSGPWPTVAAVVALAVLLGAALVRSHARRTGSTAGTTGRGMDGRGATRRGGGRPLALDLDDRAGPEDPAPAPAAAEGGERTPSPRGADGRTTAPIPGTADDAAGRDEPVPLSDRAGAARSRARVRL